MGQCISHTHLEPLIKIQKKGIWAITFSEFSAPSEPLFQRTNILNFDKLVFQRSCLMMFKHHIGVFPNLFRIYSKLTTIITAMVHVTHNHFRTPIGKSEVIYQTFTYIGLLA